MGDHDSSVKRFLDRQTALLRTERNAEIEQTSLLLTSCSPKLLEKKGLALCTLGVVSVNIGLGGKSLVELERPSIYHTSQLFPPHQFRPGDIARIEENTSLNVKKAAKTASKKGTHEAFAEDGIVFKITDTKVVIVLSETDSDFDIPEVCRIVKLANSATYDRMDRAIDTIRHLILSPEDNGGDTRPVGANPPRRSALVEVLLGVSVPSEATSVPSLNFLDQSLNNSQKEAVKFALESPELALIHGPPGTGKTHTLVEIVRQFVAQGKRLLVCGASNLAVDNLLERLVPHGIPLTRLGHPARVLSSLHDKTLDSQASRSDDNALAKDVKKELESAMEILSGKGKVRLKGAERRKMWDEVKELRKEYRKRESVVVKRVMAAAQVVLATCHSAGGRQLQHTVFDVVIIDEATQALEAVCWIPILKGNKLILAGDPLQLPPTIMSVVHSTKKAPTKSKPVILSPKPGQGNIASKNSSPTKGKPTLQVSESLEVTLFDRIELMYGKAIVRMLTVQYRMHQIIADFPSMTLYESALISHKSVASHLLRDLPNASTDADTIADVLEIPVVFFDTAGCEYFERLEDSGATSSARVIDDEGSKCNENEAVVVKVWVQKLVDAGINPSQIAVITPYQAQVALLSNSLKSTMPDLEIGTVDGMQGREKEAVVLSLVRSNEKREVGFLREKRRLNVAMTRPKRHLCVIGDSSTVSSGSKYLKSWMDWLESHADVRYGDVS